MSPAALMMNLWYVKYYNYTVYRELALAFKYHLIQCHSFIAIYCVSTSSLATEYILSSTHYFNFFNDTYIQVLKSMSQRV